MTKENRYKEKYSHGCKHPDDCFIRKKTNDIFIIEAKTQDGGGSVCEKLQTANYTGTLRKETGTIQKVRKEVARLLTRLNEVKQEGD